MKYVPRDQWGAREPDYRNVMPRPVALGVVHHKGQTDAQGRYIPANPDPYQDMRDIQRFHLGKGWSDGAYQECVATVPGYEGWVFEGRGFGFIGGATGTPPGDARSLSICVLDNCDHYDPVPAVLESIAQRFAYCEKIGRLSPGWEIKGDKDYNSTACPGSFLYAKLGYIRDRAQQIVDGLEPTPIDPDPPTDPEDDMKWLYYQDESNGTELVVCSDGKVRLFGPKALRELRVAEVIPPTPAKIPHDAARQFLIGGK